MSPSRACVSLHRWERPHIKYLFCTRALYDFKSACFLWISALSNASRHILTSSHLFLWRLRSREGVAMSVSGDARGEEREGWDGALYKQKNHSIWEWVADLNHSLLIERKQDKLLKWERTRRQGSSRRGHIRRRKQGGFLCWECRNKSMSHRSHFLGTLPPWGFSCVVCSTDFYILFFQHAIMSEYDYFQSLQSVGTSLLT